MQRFSLLQQGDLVKIHLVALLSQVGMWSNTTGIFNVMEVRYEHDNYLVVEQVTTNVM